MENIIINNNDINNNLPEGITYKNNLIQIEDKTYYKQAIIFKVTSDIESNYTINIGKSVEVKMIIEVENSSTEKTNYNFEVNIDENSNIEYLVVSELESDDATFDHVFNVSKNSNLDLLGGFVSNILKSKLHIKLNGENSSVDVKAIVISSDDNKQDVEVLIEHYAPNSYGEMTNVGVVNKNGQIILNGIEKIHKGMKNVSAFQTLKGITMSDQAKIEVNPVLLIDEHEIKAGHGATIGKLEDEMIFYLMSRGISKKDAEKLIIMGFLQPVIDKIKDEPLKDKFVKLVNLRI